MGKINGCLKCLFIFFNVISALIGCGLIYLVVKFQPDSSQLSEVGAPSMAWGWVFAIGVFGISCLGIFAACSENLIALRIFAAFMGFGLIFMLICGIAVVVYKNKVKELYDNASAEMAKTYIEDDKSRGILEKLQKNLHCCGVVSSEDWNMTIPDSCDCYPALGGGFNQSGGGVNPSGASGYECISRPKGFHSGPDKIFKQSCSEAIFGWVNLAFQIMMGFFFGLAVTALLGLLVSIMMIHQVKRYDSGRGASMPMKAY
ncbi:CD63 antigen-like [Anarrhichthys ocellatus]|uniref:CD63 antigen-like n=1 Tax=Anarrhichthys ocellatus TaxID=433405 RepID=UPI0012EEBCF8|nr:CD63 antigen-like [Anarrhichthys ocellatus]